MKEILFPQYRRIKGFDRFYKITSNETFVEAYLQKNALQFSEIKAEQYPEKLRIMDMLSCENPFIKMSEVEVDTYFSTFK